MASGKSKVRANQTAWGRERRGETADLLSLEGRCSDRCFTVQDLCRYAMYRSCPTMMAPSWFIRSQRRRYPDSPAGSPGSTIPCARFLLKSGGDKEHISGFE